MSEKLSAKNSTLSSRFGMRKTIFRAGQQTNQNNASNTSSNKQTSKR